MTTLYYSEFRSKDGYDYRIEILKDFIGSAQEIKLMATPIKIDWPDVDKVAPIHKSRATLSLYSDTDSKFTGLYTTVVGAVKLRVLRDGVLYWSGTMDTEQYEEPYSYKQGYAVSITFSDLAPLGRSKWSGTGIQTIGAILNECITKSGIENLGVVNYISTSEDIMTHKINTEIFYNSQKSSTYLDVLEKVLQPFALKIKQQNGRIYIFDLNDLYSQEASTLTAKGNDAYISADKVYNNVVVRLSPAESLTIVDAKVDYDSVRNWGVRTVRVDNHESSPKGFDLYTDIIGEGLSTVSGEYFKIDPVYSGQKEAGIAWRIKTAYNTTEDTINPAITIAENTSYDYVLRVPDLKYINSIGGDNRIRIKLSMLFDVRYNPFEPEGDRNEKDNYKDMKNWCNFAYIPFTLLLKDDSGNVIAYYKNKNVYDSNSFPVATGWVYGSGWARTDAYLAFYNTTNRKSETGLGGWQTNRPCIGFYQDKLPKIYEYMNDGEYIPLPNIPGRLEFTVYPGVNTFDYGREMKPINPKVRWLLYRDVKIELVDRYGKSLETNDVEYSAWLTEGAEEELSIDTVIGTMKDPFPTSKGLILDHSGNVVSKFTRAGRYDYLENLLIGTVYSNYAARKNVIEGTYKAIHDLKPVTEGSKKYFISADELDLRAGKSSLKLIEFSPDTYTGIEYGSV